MSYSTDRIVLDTERESRISHFRTWVLFVVPLLSILFYIYIPQFFPFLSYLELPLLVTIYFAMMRRSQTGGLLIGAVMGIAQDSLSGNKLGMYGICKTLVGYFSASIGLKIDVSHPVIRLVVVFTFYVFHQFLFWVMQRALLSRVVLFDWRQTLVVGGLNALVGVAIFHFLDKLKERT